MLTLERARTGFLALPLLVHVGLVILVIGGLADVAAHRESAGHMEDLPGHTASQLWAHLIGFAGVVVILLGFVVYGVRRTLRHRAESRA